MTPSVWNVWNQQIYRQKGDWLLPSTGARRRQEVGVTTDGYRVSWGDEKVFRLDCSEGSLSLPISKITELHNLSEWIVQCVTVSYRAVYKNGSDTAELSPASHTCNWIAVFTHGHLSHQRPTSFCLCWPFFCYHRMSLAMSKPSSTLHFLHMKSFKDGSWYIWLQKTLQLL